MLLRAIFCLLVAGLVIVGPGWPLASRLKLAPAEKVVASVVLSLLIAYLASFGIYLLALPNLAYVALPALGGLGLLLGRGSPVALWREADARALLSGQALITVWCVGWLALVVSYSGGGWTADWFEHWQRTRFFLEHWPLHREFIGNWLLPARPPLANLLVSALLGNVGTTFGAYQLFMTVLNSLVFLPAALLARRFFLSANSGSPAAAPGALAVLVVMLMLNPSLVENATFAWTKLITAFFVLGGLYFFLRVQDGDAPAAAPLCAASLGAGILAHYSAGPYVLVLVVAWFASGHRHWREPAFWRMTAWAGLTGALILATWFGWSAAKFGREATLYSNSSFGTPISEQTSLLRQTLLNLRDTIIPHFLRPVDESLIAQSSRWGYVRDWFFQLYQVNLLAVFGSVAWLVLGRELLRRPPTTASPGRKFWTLFTAGVVLLGVAVTNTRDIWGLAHVCLLALVPLGLAWLAARWSSLSRGWRITLLAGAGFDLACGIGLQFAVESQALDRWLHPGQSPDEFTAAYAPYAMSNLLVKRYGRVGFFSEELGLPGALVLALLAAILTLAVLRAARASRPPA